MKTYLKILFTLVIAISVGSCKKSSLDVEPNGVISELSFWKTEADADLALTGCYRGFESWISVVYGDGASDNGYAQYSYGFQELGNGSITAAFNTNAWPDEFSGRWFAYNRLRKYNEFLTRIEGINMDEKKKSRIKDEVRFLRAFDYFNKVIRYGDVPLVKEVINDVQAASLPRTPVVEVEKFIFDELDAIIANKNLQADNMVVSGGHATLGAAYALKARLKLYLGQYKDAQEAAKAVIDMPVFKLYPNYAKMFLQSTTDNEEAIFNIQYAQNNYRQMASRTLLPNSSAGWAGMQATFDLVKAYESKDGSPFNENEPFKNRDPRLAMTFLYPGAPYTGAGKSYFDPYEGPDKSGAPINCPSLMPVQKYADASNTNPENGGGYFMLFRLAEMYLTFAEASLKTGIDQDLALSYVNKIRQRPGVDMPAATTLTEALVRNERRVELAFEGLRYFDIKRWNIGATALNGTVYGARLGKVDQSTGQVAWSGTNVKVEERVFKPERNYLLPIPQTEINVNKNIPPQSQNKGYF